MQDEQDDTGPTEITHYLFVYGTLKRGFGNNRLLEQAAFLGEAISTDADFGMVGEGIPYVFRTRGIGLPVRGEVYLVTTTQLERCDKLEGHPDWYKREQHPFVTERGREYPAWIYLNEGARPRTRAFDEVLVRYGRYLEWPALPAPEPADDEAGLCAELKRWCKREGLEYLSADELLLHDITPEQRRYLSRFMNRWEAVVD